MPAISIILPVYNGIKYIEQSVNSVLQQQFTDFEFLIVDDCSGDGCWEYLQGIEDKRLLLYRNEKNKGLFYNLNFLIEKSSGPIIKIWTQDDVMYLDCIKEVVAFHQRHAEIGFSYTDRDYINADGAVINTVRQDRTPEIVSTALHSQIAFITGSIAGNIANVAINKSILDEVGVFNERMKISGDFEMWVRLAKNHPIGFIKKRLLQLRNHKGQLSANEQYLIYHLKEDIEAYRILLEYLPMVQQTEGRKLLRNNKFIFYYTLMLKAFFKGQIKTGVRFFKLLSGFDNFFILTGCYIRNKVLR